MFLQLQAKSRFHDLHLTTCLNDWDMSEEIKLTTTTDQFYQDEKRNDQYLAQWHYARISRRTLLGTENLCMNSQESRESVIQPNLWLMVNPGLACPIKYPNRATRTPSRHAAQAPVCRAASVSPVQSLLTLPISGDKGQESILDGSLSSEYQVTDEDDASSVDIPVCRKVKAPRKARVPKDTMQKLSVHRNKRLQRALKESDNLKNGAWPRPPVNYCILIAMALSSSRTGSLNVQQIYNFTREHFPFFLTAPDGWKNTIRHNLCFSNSFRKTPQEVSSEGKRKSCLWHLTLDGRRRLRDEIHTLSEEAFRMLKRSMNYPDMIQALFEL